MIRKGASAAAKGIELFSDERQEPTTQAKNAVHGRDFVLVKHGGRISVATQYAQEKVEVWTEVELPVAPKPEEIDAAVVEINDFLERELLDDLKALAARVFPGVRFPVLRKGD